MAVIVKEYRSGTRCVFKSICDHAPATHRYIHEFSNHPEKPLCDEHVKRIQAFENRPRKKARRARL